MNPIVYRLLYDKPFIPSKGIYHKVYKIFKNETGVRDIPDLLVCAPPKAGTTNWSRVLWQLKYLNELGILVDKHDENYINFTNIYQLWLRNIPKNWKRLKNSVKSDQFFQLTLRNH